MSRGRRETLRRRLHATSGGHRQVRRGARVSLNKLSCKVPEDLSATVQASLLDWKTNQKVARLWDKDATLWTGDDEANWLGWLTIAEEQLKDVQNLKKLGQEIKKAKFRHA